MVLPVHQETLVVRVCPVLLDPWVTQDQTAQQDLEVTLDCQDLLASQGFRVFREPLEIQDQSDLPVRGALRVFEEQQERLDSQERQETQDFKVLVDFREIQDLSELLVCLEPRAL